jgi:predicted metal-dependent hydrolase
MSQYAHIELPNGRQLNYEIRLSAKAHSLRLKMTAREVLTVIAPKGLNEQKVVDLVNGKRDWIAAKLSHFEEVRHLLGEQESVSPEAFDLPALAESWRVEYHATKGKTVGARTDQLGRLIVFGAVDDNQRCKSALRRWLARRAKEVLAPRLDSLASESGLRINRIIIKNQRTLWGSCTSDGVISLNAKLLFLSPPLVRYVLMHELCHTLERNHTVRFWTHLRQFEPQTDFLHGAMRDAWKRVPGWAHPMQAGRESL